MNSANVLVLDFGGVVSRTLFETHSLTEAALGLPVGSLTWKGPFAPDTDPLWIRMQANEISERDYWATRTREVGELVGETWTKMEQFVVAARGADVGAVIRPEFIEALKIARLANKRCAILSNELDLFYGESFRERLPFMNDFELVVDATHTQILKPDQRAYRFITDGLNVSADDCVFVDDQLRNIEGAQAFGMRTVHFDVANPRASYTQALAELGLGFIEEEREVV